MVHDPVGHGVINALFPALFQGLVDGDAIPLGPLGYLSQGEPEGFLVEGMGLGSIGGQVDHLLESGSVCPAASRVFPTQYSGLLVTEGAGADGRFQEVGEGHDFLFLRLWVD